MEVSGRPCGRYYPLPGSDLRLRRANLFAIVIPCCLRCCEEEKWN